MERVMIGMMGVSSPLGWCKSLNLSYFLNAKEGL
jgi:hypothetical protein